MAQSGNSPRRELVSAMPAPTHAPEEDATTQSQLKADARAPEADLAEDEMSTTEGELEGDGPEDIDDLEDIEDDELDDDVALDDDDVDVSDDGIALEDEDEDEVEPVLVVVAPGAKAKAKTAEPAEAPADTETDEDELQADEVEASLDVILADRLRGDVSEIDEPNEDDDEEDDAPNQLETIIPVRRPDEFLCQSCFLLKPPAQLADADHQLCRDCA